MVLVFDCISDSCAGELIVMEAGASNEDANDHGVDSRSQPREVRILYEFYYTICLNFTGYDKIKYPGH